MILNSNTWSLNLTLKPDPYNLNLNPTIWTQKLKIQYLAHEALAVSWNDICIKQVSYQVFKKKYQ
jgi:hypothetical protein